MTVPNPAVNAFSALSCQASGNTLSLALDGISKLSAVDASFTTGSVGFSIVSKGSASHRADDFSATVR
jgi:hypothetical protein